MAGRKKGTGGKPETADEKFVRLAEQRVGSAIKYLDLIANLASDTYKSTEAQRKQILDALDAHVQTVKDRFAGKAGAGGGFRLS